MSKYTYITITGKNRPKCPHCGQTDEDSFAHFLEDRFGEEAVLLPDTRWVVSRVKWPCDHADRNVFLEDLEDEFDGLNQIIITLCDDTTDDAQVWVYEDRFDQLENTFYYQGNNGGLGHDVVEAVEWYCGETPAYHWEDKRDE